MPEMEFRNWRLDQKSCPTRASVSDMGGQMQRAIDIFYKFLEILLILLLSGMAIMVFLNVVLRYGFNSGINVSDELARYFFVWLPFIGAVVTFREHAHLGVETLVTIGSASCRERVCQYVSISVVAVSLKKKTTH